MNVLKYSSARKCLIVVIALASLVAAIAALSGRPPGRGNWIGSLAGDWSIQLSNDYVIGPSDTLPDGNYQVLRWREIGEKRYAIEFVVDGMKTYGVYGDEVLLQSAGRWILPDSVTRERAVHDGPKWILINTLTGEKAIYNEPNLPDRFAGYRQNMELPNPSLRGRLILLSSILMVVLIRMLNNSRAII